ncbi:hypothetical protein [Streptomyces sp. NRRL S-1868]|nr:hypothetical protein [Streptomyces sp. NRRL S-1868]
MRRRLLPEGFLDGHGLTLRAGRDLASTAGHGLASTGRAGLVPQRAG